MQPCCLLPGAQSLRCEQVVIDQDVITIHVISAAAGSRCPTCGCESRRVHSHDHRKLADLPCLGRRVQIRWRSRRLFCDQPCAHCGRAVSGERKTKKTQSGPKDYIYYFCTHHKKPEHPPCRVRENQLDGVTLGYTVNKPFDAMIDACDLNESGEGGIRTLGRDRPYTGFRNQHLQPLGHLSKRSGRADNG